MGFDILTLFVLSGVANAALYDKSSDVVELTTTNFQSKVIDSDKIWIVEFYAPWCGHCQQLAPEYSKAAKALKGVVNIGAVNMDEHQSVGAPYNVQGFPTIKIFGIDKKKPIDYNGQRAAQGIIDKAMSELNRLVQYRLSGKTSSSSEREAPKSDGKDVVELTDSNFEELVLNSDEMWLVEFFAPWCGHCKNLAPHWASAASELRDKKIKLGALDATVHTVIANKFNIRGFPTIKFFPAGHKTLTDAQEYDGGRTSSDIVQWANVKLAENVPAPEIVQITSEDVTNACVSHQLCIIAFLPHILDCQSECRNKYLETLKQLGDKFKKHMWGWVWAEAMTQPELEEGLGIGGFGYPAMAALNARKMKYSVLRGSFGFDGISEYLKELAYKGGSPSSLKGSTLPKVVKTDPWDGKDGELPVEEEIDLSKQEL